MLSYSAHVNIFLETDRLIIRLTSINDFNDILALRSNPEVQKYTTQPPATKEDVQRFIDMIIPYQEKLWKDSSIEEIGLRLGSRL